MMKITNPDPWYFQYKDLPLEELRSHPINILEITTASYYCLYRANIKTIGDLLDLGHAELQLVPGIGRRRYDDVDIAIHLLGFYNNNGWWMKREIKETECTTTK